MKIRQLLRFSFLLLTCSAFGQNTRVDGVVYRASGFPAPGSSIAVCTQPATIGTSLTACTPLAPLCASATSACSGSQGGGGDSANPVTSDGLGNYHFYIKPGKYSYQFYGSGLTTILNPDQTIPAALDTNNAFTGSNTFGSLNKQFIVDGTLYATVQAAMTAANAAGGGVVLVPDGTYAAPATWYSSVAVIAEHNVRPQICPQGVNGFNCFGATSSNAAAVKFTSTSALTISDLTKIAIVGVTFDFTGSATGNLILSGIANSYFDFSVTAAAGFPALTVSGTLNNGFEFNDLPYLGLYGGSEGIHANGGVTNNRVVTDNRFGFIQTAMVANSTYTAFNCVNWTDTNTFQTWQMYTPYTGGGGAINGVIFNSSSAVADADCNNNTIGLFAQTGATITVGSGVTFNPSSGNQIQTGILNFTTQKTIAAGGPGNSPSYQETLSSATPGTVTNVESQIFSCWAPNATSSCEYDFYRGTALGWQLNYGTDGNLHWIKNPTPADEMILNTGGTLDVGPQISSTGTGLVRTGTVKTDQKGNFGAQNVFNNTGPGGSATQTLVTQAGSGQGSTDTFEVQAAGTSGSGTVLTSLNGSGVVNKYNNITAVANGIPSIYGATGQKSESAADTNVLTFTPPASTGSYRVRFTMSVSAANAATLGWTATWKDSNAAAQAPTNLALFQSGTAAPALTFTTSTAGNYYGYIDIDTDASATNLVIKLTFSGTSFAAKVSATIERII